MCNHSDSKFDLHFEKLQCIVLHSWVHQSVIDVVTCSQDIYYLH